MASEPSNETQQSHHDVSGQDYERSSTPQPDAQSRTPTPKSFEMEYTSANSGSRKLEPVENRLRPAADIINRIIWDPAFDGTNYVIGYEDRFEGRLESSFYAWKKETTDEEFIPQHRILYIKRRSDGEIVWDRRRRIDKIFNSGNSAFDYLGFLA
ncbi:leukocyte receptor cluster (LRC) member 9 [Aspergillus brasiliensis]|uniref:Leukocyte receptor cluster (LRC) member 9 n=1 Tax=Aspergillus brasiliensis TaxID=319629 RepID=A0A9W6DSH7_9EURO|nr:leukocyte receptor cluster (LRC) member 9 [Aspergillus brasiliensis]GKZ40883.1 leukocyte receptor cluster (LRC) member 9 [Aspergillus brasiliensis]